MDVPRHVWDEMQRRYDELPHDGINAHGAFSEALRDRQQEFRKGFLMGRLAALRCVERIPD